MVDYVRIVETTALPDVRHLKPYKAIVIVETDLLMTIYAQA